MTTPLFNGRWPSAEGTDAVLDEQEAWLVQVRRGNLAILLESARAGCVWLAERSPVPAEWRSVIGRIDCAAREAELTISHTVELPAEWHAEAAAVRYVTAQLASAREHADAAAVRRIVEDAQRECEWAIERSAACARILALRSEGPGGDR